MIHMKQYHALVIDTANPFEVVAPKPDRHSINLVMTSYNTLLELMLDNTWNVEGNAALRRVVYRTFEDGSLQAVRYCIASEFPKTATWYELDCDDYEDRGYLYGANLTDEQKDRIEEAHKGRREEYETWQAKRRKAIEDWYVTEYRE